MYWSSNRTSADLSAIARIFQAAAEACPIVAKADSLLTRELNRLRDREGPMWSSRNRSIECVDDAAAEDRLLYSMSNPVKDGLCDKVKHWNKISFSAYSQLAEGKREKFSYINWTKWHRAGGKRSGKEPEEFTEWVEVEFQPLPHLVDMPAVKREARLRRQLRELEQAERDKRKKQNRPSMTLTRLLKTDPRQRPQTTRVRTPMPLCHASSTGARDEFKHQWKEHLDAFITASGQFREEKFEAEFPAGSFRPPLTTVCTTIMRC